MLTDYHSPTHLFSPVHFSFSASGQLEWLSHCKRTEFLCNFHFLVWLLLLMPHPLIGPFIFRDLVCHYQEMVPGQVVCVGLIVFQEHQAITMILHRIVSTYKVVALHLDNSTAKAYLCNQGGTVSPFLSRLACWVLSLTDRHGITLIPAKIPTHLTVRPIIFPGGQMLPECHLLPQVA